MANDSASEPATMPSARLTTPRITGRRKTGARSVSERQGRSRTTISPLGRRTATAYEPGARISTPSTTAWPPTLGNGVGMQVRRVSNGPPHSLGPLVFAVEALHAALGIDQLLLA